MKMTLTAVLALLSGIPAMADQSPYSGQELLSVKSLSPEEIESLRSGRGMGFAKLAELNHYPGPRHVLELKDQLLLTPLQAAETRALFEEMRLNAIVLGEELIAAEMALDRSFANGAIDAESLDSALTDIGTIRARLRFVHLEAHLRQRRLLTAAQIARYDELRGYSGAAHGDKVHRLHHEPPAGL